MSTPVWATASRTRLMATFNEGSTPTTLFVNWRPNTASISMSASCVCCSPVVAYQSTPTNSTRPAGMYRLPPACYAAIAVQMP
jgi:hypothetical protein